jgi:hypothetical protein
LPNGKDDIRDFRITNDSVILAEFLNDFQKVKDHYVMGKYVYKESIAPEKQ